MSTRTNILVTLGMTKIFIYRHCDGYPAETGADILEKLQTAGKQGFNGRFVPGNFIGALLGEMYEKQSYETCARHVYEITNDWHGDIEHAYIIGFSEELTIHHAARVNYEMGNWISRRTKHTLETFADLVNRDRTETNRRILKLQHDNPGNPHYADMGLYPMVETH